MIAKVMKKRGFNPDTGSEIDKQILNINKYNKKAFIRNLALETNQVQLDDMDVQNDIF